MSNKDKIEKLLANVESALESINTNEQWLKYISFASKFTSYSVTNQLLIYMQNPEASYVAGYRSWETKFNRHVKAGSKAIKILAPSFKKVEVVKEPNNPNVYMLSKSIGYHQRYHRKESPYKAVQYQK